MPGKHREGPAHGPEERGNHQRIPDRTARMIRIRGGPAVPRRLPRVLLLRVRRSAAGDDARKPVFESTGFQRKIALSVVSTHRLSYWAVRTWSSTPDLKIFADL